MILVNTRFDVAYSPAYHREMPVTDWVGTRDKETEESVENAIVYKQAWAMETWKEGDAR